MSKQNRIVVIGGSACGPKAVARARRCDPQAKITIVEQGEHLSQATCGLPYYVAGVIEKESTLTVRKPDFFINVMNMDVLMNTRALSIDRKAHEVKLVNLKTDQASSIPYDKLVLATGSSPVVPNLPGKDLKGIFTLSKIKDSLAIREFISQKNNMRAVIVGAGLIGMEMTEALADKGLQVTVIEALDWVLPGLLDREIAALLEKYLRSEGVNLLTGQKVKGFEGDGDGRVKKVITESGGLDADIILLAVGVRPNIKLAQDAGLEIGPAGGISVDKYLRTSDPDIYAGGDCVENVHLVTRQKVLAPLGSTANKHGRVIGSNVTGGNDTFPGVLGTGIVKVFDYNIGRVGLSETQARQAGYNVITCLAPGFEHASYYPKSKRIVIKLVVDRSSNRLLGGQVIGQGQAAKRVDVLATALTFGATVDDLANLDLAYAPPYNTALDPLHHTANVIRNKQAGDAKSILPAEVKGKMDRGEDFVLLDVRAKAEWEKAYIKAKQAKLLPLPELRNKLDTLPKEGEIVTTCELGMRAYQAQKILDSAGFKNVKFMEGSITAWPYEVAEEKNSK